VDKISRMHKEATNKSKTMNKQIAVFEILPKELFSATFSDLYSDLYMDKTKVLAALSDILFESRDGLFYIMRNTEGGIC